MTRFLKISQISIDNYFRKITARLSLLFLLTFGFIIHQPAFGQEASVVVKVIDDDTLENLEGVKVEVYDEEGFVTSGVTTENGVTFGLLTDIQDTQTESVVRYDDKNGLLTYPGKANIVLSDILGRQKSLSNRESEFAIKEALQNRSAGHYFFNFENEQFTGFLHIIKTDNNTYSRSINTPQIYIKQKREIKLGKLISGKNYTFYFSSDTHYPDSLNYFVEADAVIEQELSDEKEITLTILNNETDEPMDGYVKINGDSVSVNGSTLVNVMYADTVTFEAGGLYNGEAFSFIRTKKVAGSEVGDLEMQVVDYFVRDKDKAIVGQLNVPVETGQDVFDMTPERFRGMMNVAYLNTPYSGVGDESDARWPFNIHRWDTEDGLPERIVVYRKVELNDGSEWTMEQSSIDAIEDWYAQTVPALLGDLQAPPLEYNDMVTQNDLLDEESHLGQIQIYPRGNLSVDGQLITFGSAEHIENMRIALRSGPPNGAPQEYFWRRRIIEQEGWNALTGSGASDGYAEADESVIHDFTTLQEASPLDYKGGRIWINESYKQGEKGENILKLPSNLP